MAAALLVLPWHGTAEAQESSALRIALKLAAPAKTELAGQLVLEPLAGGGMALFLGSEEGFSCASGVLGAGERLRLSLVSAPTPSNEGSSR